MNSFADFFWYMIEFYILFMIIWIFIRVFADIFRRTDMKGGMKALWIIVHLHHPVLRCADLHHHATQDRGRPGVRAWPEGRPGRAAAAAAAPAAPRLLTRSPS